VVRQIQDNDVLWLIYEYSVGPAASSLIFESTTAFRRVRVFPATWATLSDSELMELSVRP
jgi:hypothetical protein